MLRKIQSWLENIFATASGQSRRPLLNKNRESNIPGLFVIGDLAGAPVIKLCLEQGFETVEYIASLPRPKKADASVLDVIVIGAGAAGLNAALTAQDKGLSCLVLEKEKIANTIENFPEGKWVYAEPDTVPPKGKLWLDGATKEDLIKRWHQIIRDNHLEVHTGEPVTGVNKQDGIFTVTTPKAEYRSCYVILATGQRGNPRKLGVPGEEQEHVYHRLYSPRKYKNEDILVVGGGNSAVEAALTLSEQNRVTLSYRGSEFRRIFKDNERKLNQAVASGKIKLILNSNVKQFIGKTAILRVDRGGHEEEITVNADHAFVLIGAELPVKFLKSLGIRLENEWEGSFWRAAGLALAALVGVWFAGGHTGLVPEMSASIFAFAGAALTALSIFTLIFMGRKGNRWAWLAISFLVWYTVYGIKVGKGEEFWPFRGWGYHTFSFFDRPWSFWYTVMYTTLMTVFGIQALKRWGLERRDRFQIWRYVSLLSFQWIFFFIVPEFLFQWAIKYQWLGQLSHDPVFAQQAWRSYGIVYAWPLFFYTFFYNPHQIWVIWGLLLSFVIIPIFVIFHGKRYCSWICGCGGLAETFGDRWRHLAPKGKTSIKWEWMNTVILLFAVVATLLMVGKDVYGLFSKPAQESVKIYRLLADVWLVGILPVTLYPFLGGKVWCRYWCPLAKMMGLMSKFYARLGISRFHITANDKCIACYECSRNCQVGIDVMSYALKQDVLDNKTSSCIGCGICVTVCPMDVLSFSPRPQQFVPISSVGKVEVA
ncbi:MAG: FAD-binding protein [Calditrichaeota bacterium]|nr:MAG: FAD-binding protein [Calditrichota bacterium]